MQENNIFNAINQTLVNLSEIWLYIMILWLISNVVIIVIFLVILRFLNGIRYTQHSICERLKSIDPAD